MQTTALYRSEDLRKGKKRAHWLVALCVSYWIALFAIAIPLCFFVDDATIGWISFAISASSVLFVWAFIYTLTGYLLPLKAHNELTELVLNSAKKEVLGKVTKAGAIRTPSRFLRSFVVEVEMTESKRNLYFEMALGPLPFKEGDEVRLEEVSNFIVSYEVLL